MLSRSLRAETRNRSKEEVKRVINTIERVRKWEQRWVTLRDSTVRVLKWIPVTESESLVTNRKAPASINITKLTNENAESSQDSTDYILDFEGQESDQKASSNFSETNDDSNGNIFLPIYFLLFYDFVAFSEPCFDSDSNQAIMNNGMSNQVSGASDFSDLMKNEQAALNSKEDENDKLSEEPEMKRRKNL
ncbi:BCL7-like protein C28H8.1 [Trichinella pseudospiralis]|uniref:BCL7-like protein C28H8.1 n=1 Tax=Trichinella pseudospiralis TaxID=6337 RepID=A0A0V1JFR6_TRIPS|nr:BCL7-like protein C28H8.1 [Trichinella pseudospiralis]KRZ33827.1 BCL7-like protein C28H8.1 [Trichinella pseudospiralis]